MTRISQVHGCAYRYSVSSARVAPIRCRSLNAGMTIESCLADIALGLHRRDGPGSLADPVGTGQEQRDSVVMNGGRQRPFILGPDQVLRISIGIDDDRALLPGH